MSEAPEKPRPKHAPVAGDRAARRAAALRENLKRRKAQSRARESAEAAGPPAKRD